MDEMLSFGSLLLCVRVGSLNSSKGTRDWSGKAALIHRERNVQGPDVPEIVSVESTGSYNSRASVVDAFDEVHRWRFAW